MKRRIFSGLLCCLLFLGIVMGFTTPEQRNQLIWDRVMADGTPNMVAGWDSNGDPAEVAQPNGISGLTATRIPVAASATSLTDDADLTWTAATNTLTAGRIVPVPTSNQPGLNVGTFAGDPAQPVDGDVWLNTVGTDALRARVNGTTINLNAVKDIVAVSNIDFPSTLAGGRSTANAAVFSASVGDPAIIGFPNAPTDGIVYAYISATNTVTFVFINTSTATIDPAAQNFNVIVFNR